MRRLAMAGFGLLLVYAACSDGEHGGGDNPPAAPSSLRVSKLGGGGHLTWTDNSNDEDEFMIMRKEGNGAYVDLGRVTFNTTQYHDEPLTAGVTYTYMVMAMSDGGQSSSNEVTYTHQ